MNCFDLLENTRGSTIHLINKDIKLHLQYHKNGQLGYKFYMKDKRRYGIRKSWYPSGQLCEINCYKNGKLHGVVECWYYDGSIEEKSYWEDGIMIDRDDRFKED